MEDFGTSTQTHNSHLDICNTLTGGVEMLCHRKSRGVVAYASQMLSNSTSETSPSFANVDMGASAAGYTFSSTCSCRHGVNGTLAVNTNDSLQGLQSHEISSFGRTKSRQVSETFSKNFLKGQVEETLCCNQLQQSWDCCRVYFNLKHLVRQQVEVLLDRRLDHQRWIIFGVPSEQSAAHARQRASPNPGQQKVRERQDGCGVGKDQDAQTDAVGRTEARGTEGNVQIDTHPCARDRDLTLNLWTPLTLHISRAEYSSYPARISCGCFVVYTL